MMSEENRQQPPQSGSEDAWVRDETDSNTGAEAGDDVEQPVDDTADGQMTLEQALEKLARTEQALVSQQDEVLRTRAEMQNLRRRTEMDIEKAHKFGQERLVNELLTVIDNLERALQAVPDQNNETVRPLCEGVELTLKSFLGVLEKFNVEQLDPQGAPFDPQVHEAITMQDNPDVEPNTVIAVMQKGYTLHGRVIRPARVVVSREPSGGSNKNA